MGQQTDMVTVFLDRHIIPFLNNSLYRFLQSKKINGITILADGTDPLTGEVLPDDHVCNKGEIVRALNCAVEALSRKRKKPLPENTGKPWTEELDQELCRLFDEGMKKKDLCAHFARTPGAIESRLQRLGKM